MKIIITIVTLIIVISSVFGQNLIMNIDTDNKVITYQNGIGINITSKYSQWGNKKAFKINPEFEKDFHIAIFKVVLIRQEVVKFYISTRTDIDKSSRKAKNDQKLAKHNLKRLEKLLLQYGFPTKAILIPDVSDMTTWTSISLRELIESDTHFITNIDLLVR